MSDEWSVDPWTLKPQSAAERPRILIPVPTSRDAEYNRRNWPQYAAAVREAGGEAVRLEISVQRDQLLDLLGDIDGLVLPGSPSDVDPGLYGQAGDPACAPPDERRECIDRELLAWASESNRPSLGVCYGLQSMNVSRRGSLIQHLAGVPVNHAAGPSVGVAHTIGIDPHSKYGVLVDRAESKPRENWLELFVNSSHHQAVDRLGEGLRAVALSPRDGVIEAVEGFGAGAWFVGVQWHPERSLRLSASSSLLFRELVRVAGSGRVSG